MTHPMVCLLLLLCFHNVVCFNIYNNTKVVVCLIYIYDTSYGLSIAVVVFSNNIYIYILTHPMICL